MQAIGSKFTPPLFQYLAVPSGRCCLRRAHTNYKLIEVYPESQNQGLRRIWLSDKKTKNSLSLNMMEELIHGISYNGSNDNLRAISIESADGSVFSAGHNLKELKSEVPVIGVVNGLAAAAGCQLVAACDFAICSSTSTFSTPGANFGLFCSTPGVEISRVLNRSVTAYMIMTGISLSAMEAERAGLVVKSVPVMELDQTLNEIYSHISNKSRHVVALGKQFFYAQLQHPYEDAIRLGENIMIENLELHDCKEGLQSFKEKRKPNWGKNLNISNLSDNN